MSRRHFLTAIVGALALGFLPRGAKAAKAFEVTRSDAEWKAMLSKLEYKVMRQDGTERAFTSPLDKNWADGLYHCRGCDQKLYSSNGRWED